MKRLLVFVLSLFLLFYATDYWFGFSQFVSQIFSYAMASLSILLVLLVWFSVIPKMGKNHNAEVTLPLRQPASVPLAIAETVRRQEYVDKLTKLGNRSFFNARLDVLLIPHRLTGEGSVVLISLTGLENYYNEDDTEETYLSVIAEAAVLIENAVCEQSNVIISRVSPLEFAVIVHPISKNQSKKIATVIEHALRQLQLPEILNDGNFFHIGVTTFSSETSRFELMANADLALRSAQLKGGSCWYQLDDDNNSPTWGMVQWRTLF